MEIAAMQYKKYCRVPKAVDNATKERAAEAALSKMLG
jgi:hypothetical protein